jgi:hypothetical protein
MTTTSDSESRPQSTDERVADAVVSRLYRRFKDWSQRGFSAEDVTWCEVKADILAMIREERAASVWARLLDRLWYLGRIR